MYTIRELADLFGVPVRTIHHYVQVGLLPRPVGRTRNARYTAEHVWRLRMIRQTDEGRVTRADLLDQFAPDDDA